MRAGKQPPVPLFREKRFWPSLFWLGVMVAGTAVGSMLRMPEFLVAVILSAFLGLNEVGRWSYKTNLVFCAGAAVIAVFAGTLNWIQTGSLFLLLVILTGFMLYFRDRTKRMLPTLEEFASVLSRGKNAAQVASAAVDEIGEMTGEAVFVALTDGRAGLYMPEYREDKRIDLKRDGGAMWKVFSSGKPYMAEKVEPQVDNPLYREARSLMSAALEYGGETIGVIQIESERSYAFSDEDLSTFCVLAFIVAQAVAPYVKTPAREETAQQVDVRKLEIPPKAEPKKPHAADTVAEIKQMALSFEEEDKKVSDGGQMALSFKEEEKREGKTTPEIDGGNRS